MHLKKQWMILKKFNLQEKIYREESKLLVESEKQKDNLIASEIIQKLAEIKMTGFEDPEVLKTRTMDKMTKTYQIDEEVLKELNCVFFDPKYTEQESTLLVTRKEAQYDAIFKISKNVPEPEYDLDNYYNNSQYKLELKRFERELETKAVQKFSNFSEDFTLSNQSKDLLEPPELYLTNSNSGVIGEAPSYNNNFNPNYNFNSFGSLNNINKSTSFNNTSSPVDEGQSGVMIKKFIYDSNDTDQIEVERLISNKNLSSSPNSNFYRSISNQLYFDDPNSYDDKQDKYNKNEFSLSKLVDINEIKVNEFKKKLLENLLSNNMNNANDMSTPLQSNAPNAMNTPNSSNNQNAMNAVNVSASGGNHSTDIYSSKILSDLNVNSFTIFIIFINRIN